MNINMRRSWNMNINMNAIVEADGNDDDVEDGEEQTPR